MMTLRPIAKGPIDLGLMKLEVVPGGAGAKGELCGIIFAANRAGHELFRRCSKT